MLIQFSEQSKYPVKASCIEALEYASKTNPGIATETWLKFVIDTCNEKAPRIKWDSAKVIGIIAHRFPEKLNKAIQNLLTNSEHTGTVVRWNTSYELGKIAKLNTFCNTDLLPAI